MIMILSIILTYTQIIHQKLDDNGEPILYDSGLVTNDK